MTEPKVVHEPQVIRQMRKDQEGAMAVGNRTREQMILGYIDRLAARVQELEDALEYGRDVSKQSQAENTRLREALDGARHNTILLMDISDDTYAEVGYAIEEIDAALKEKP